ncbi:MAG: hypothetical protein WC718_04445 [Phycisphaerales bacterium]
MVIDCLYGDLWPTRFIGRYRLNRRWKRYLSLCVLFLRSDDEYAWEKTAAVPAWVGSRHDRSGFQIDGITEILGLPICNFGCSKLERLEELRAWSKAVHEVGPRRRAWPFSTLEQLSAAKARPTYLCGSRKVA